MTVFFGNLIVSLPILPLILIVRRGHYPLGRW